MKCLGKMSLKTILKVSKNQGFNISLEAHFWKNRRSGRSDFIRNL